MLFCGGRYECEESFTTLNVDIRNHQTLLDSMEQYVKGDLLEGANAYHCEKCNKKVRMEGPSSHWPLLYFKLELLNFEDYREVKLLFALLCRWTQ